MNNVVLMVTKSYFRTTMFLSEVEELFAALPGAEKAGGLFIRGLESGSDDVERNTILLAEMLEVGGVRFVTYVFHTHMQRLDGEVGHMDLGTASEELEQT